MPQFELRIRDLLEGTAYILIGAVVAFAVFWLVTTRINHVPAPQNGTVQAESATVSDMPVITLTLAGYEPSDLTIPLGTTVEFNNTTGRPHWPASNLHPAHELYPEFDPLQPVPAEESWSFTFDKAGSWRFHDHIRAYYTGTIHVTEN